MTTERFLIPVKLAKSARFFAEALQDFSDGTLTIRFVGVLDEFANLDEVWQYIARLQNRPSRIAFDVLGVERLSSTGAKLWLAFLRPVEARFSMCFVGLGPAFVRQALVLPILGKRPEGVRGASLRATCICRGCGAEGEYEFAKGNAMALMISRDACGNCGGKMIFDDDFEAYQSLLETRIAATEKPRSSVQPRRRPVAI